MTVSDTVNFLLTGLRKDTRARMNQATVKYLGWVMVLFTIVAFVMLKFEVDSLQFAAESVNWPKVNGVITHSSVDSFTDSRNTTYSADIQYDYRVDSKAYHSSGVSLAGWANRSVIERKHYDALANKFLRGASVKVFYNPDNPQQSVIQPGVVSESIFSTALFLLSATWFAGSVIWLGAWCAQGGNYNLAGGLIIAVLIIASSILTISTALWGTKVFVELVIPKEALTAE